MPAASPGLPQRFEAMMLTTHASSLYMSGLFGVPKASATSLMALSRSGLHVCVTGAESLSRSEYLPDLKWDLGRGKTKCIVSDSALFAPLCKSIGADQRWSKSTWLLTAALIASTQSSAVPGLYMTTCFPARRALGRGCPLGSPSTNTSSSVVIVTATLHLVATKST